MVLVPYISTCEWNKLFVMFRHNVIIFNEYNFLSCVAILISIRTTTHTNTIHKHSAWITELCTRTGSVFHAHTQQQMCMHTEHDLAFVLALPHTHTHVHARAHTHTHTQMAASDLGNSRWSIWKSGKVLYYLLSSGRDKLAVCQRMEEGNWFFKRVNKIWRLNFFVHKCNPYTHSHPDTSIRGAVPNMLNNTKNKTWNQHTDRNIKLLSSALFFRRLHTQKIKYLPECQLRKKVSTLICHDARQQPYSSVCPWITCNLYYIRFWCKSPEQAYEPIAVSLMPSSHILTTHQLFR